VDSGPTCLLELLQSVKHGIHGDAAGGKRQKGFHRYFTQWVPYERISPHLKRAVIAAEDSRFLEHEGFDFDAMQKAYEKNLRKGRLVAGGSTISQQLAKNLFLSDKKTPWRKIEEALITLMLENIMSKRRIMEIYLNVIEWGEGVFGAEAAIRHYYGISSSSLSPEQAARLAAMVPNPRFYDRHRNTPWLSKTGIILSRRGRYRSHSSLSRLGGGPI
jgi:monofunctional biosynthetic peptidoglycan transglycosylase